MHPVFHEENQLKEKVSAGDNVSHEAASISHPKYGPDLHAVCKSFHKCCFDDLLTLLKTPFSGLLSNPSWQLCCDDGPSGGSHFTH